MKKTTLRTKLIVLAVVVVLIISCMALSACQEHEDWQAIVKKGYLKVGVDQAYMPFSYPNKSGQYVGFDIGYLSLLSSKLNVRIEVVPILWATAEQKLTDKSIDAIWHFTKTPVRAENFLFTESYLQDAAVALVRENCIKAIDMDYITSAKGVAAMSGSSQEEWIAKNQLENKAVYTESYLSATEMLEAGAVEVALVNKAFATYYIQHHTKQNLKLKIIETFDVLTCNVGVRLTDVVLVEKLNTAIETIRMSKDFETICDKWFGASEGFR